MVGFIKGIFGAKQAAKNETTQAPEAAPKPPKPEKQKPEKQKLEKQKPEKPKLERQKPQAFYLDTADAKTLGDIDYMQAAREIRRSFPKTLSGENPATVSVVSSLQRSQALKQQAMAQQRTQTIATSSATFATQTPSISGWATPKVDNLPKIKDPKERRRDDSNLDTFRAMARDIQKANARK